MRTWRRIAVGSAVALVAAGAALAVALHVLVDPEHVKDLSREKARAAWGRELTIGEISIGLLPAPAVTARDVVLAAHGPGPAFLQAKRIDARLALLPLLAGHARLKSLDLEGATVRVPQDGAGEVPDVSPESTQRATASPQLLDLTDLTLTNVDVVTGPRDARVRWHVPEATFASDPGWRDAEIDARVERNGEPLRVKATVADLSRLGAAGASSDGQVELAWKQTRVTLKGLLPLDHGGAAARVHVDVISPSLGDVFAFYAFERRQSARIEAHFDATARERAIEVANLDLTLGKAHGRGGFSLRPFESPRRLDAHIAIDQLDWAQAMLDVGTAAPPKRNTGLAFNPDKLAWGLLEKLEPWKGALEADVGALKLRNGVELRKAKFHFAFDGARLDVDPLQADLLGGQGTARMHFDAAKKSVKVAFDGTSLLLERWFHERGKKIPFEGGPMQIRATLDSKGESMKKLAANMSGPVSIRMGRGVYASEHAEHAEATLSSASDGGPKGIRFECVGANLPFKSGKAERVALVGASSDVSRLLTSGVIDFREQKIDLRGRLRPRSGVGLATFVGDLRIEGRMAKPGISIDQPTALARAGAAIATAGLTAAATAFIDAATVKGDKPCEEVFAVG